MNNPTAAASTTGMTTAKAVTRKLVSSLSSRSLDTPNLLIATSRCCVPHLTPDTFHRTLQPGDYCGLLVSLETLMEDDSVLPRTSPYHLDRLIGYKDTPIWIATDDPLYYRGIYLKNSTADASLKVNNGADWVSLVKDSGVSTLNLRNTLPMILKNLSPAAIIAPSDHYPTISSRLKRIKKSTDTTNVYFAHTKEASGETFVVPSIALHEACAEAEEKKYLVAGEMQRRIDLVKTASSIMSVIHQGDDLSMLKDLSTRTIILRGVIPPEKFTAYLDAGISIIFESTYATDLATQGTATNIDPSTGKTTKLSLNDPSFSADYFPLSDSCKCIACDGPDKTTKSYIHHLVMTKEMLSSVFLSSHNLWQYAYYLKSLRPSNQ